MVEGVTFGPDDSLSSWGKMESLSEEMKSQDECSKGGLGCLFTIEWVALGLVLLEKRV